MPKHTFIVETDQPDANGDIVRLDGVQFGAIKMLHNFRNHEIIDSTPSVFQDGNCLKCTAEVPVKFLDKYPAIGFTVNKYTTNPDGSKTFESITLYSIGLCDQPNPNPSIKTIREQCPDT